MQGVSCDVGILFREEAKLIVALNSCQGNLNKLKQLWARRLVESLVMTLSLMQLFCFKVHPICTRPRAEGFTVHSVCSSSAICC